MPPPKDARPRVVIADDHPSVRLGFTRLLQPACEIVASVATGHEGIAAVERLHPDVLVVDLMMGDLDGLEVCRRVKKAAPETDVVIVTAYDDARVQRVALESGATAYVAKHFAASTLEATIYRIVNDRRATQESDQRS